LLFPSSKRLNYLNGLNFLNERIARSYRKL
jgi:hypothetical protein